MSEEIKTQINPDLNSGSQSEEIVKLLRTNLERSEEILKIAQGIKSYIRWQNIWGILRLLLIAIPIVLGFIYLPPLFKDLFESYRSILQ